MRLIDADSFIEYLGLDAENAREVNLGEIVTLEDFDRQPTAYDVDKVVERLEKEIDAEVNEHFDYERATKNSHFRKAVEIVKSGGID